ncbi:hypothetical protein [Occallatibacter savannae]|uniref:hypothetical protein n=1 Tax=Occallatibacter savannae TaxID=1002691 RepID=UPI000D69A1CD|nr:hypothetical protein [Occallatibacter savannae]
MSVLADAMSGMGAALLPVAAALLFEELTFGGLVRLLLAPRPGSRRDGAAHKGRGRKEHRNHPTNQGPVCGDSGDLKIRAIGGGQ